VKAISWRFKSSCPHQKSSETDASEDFSLFFLPDGQILRHRECLIGQLPVFIVNVQMASEHGFEVAVDG
jgi:hypothetical protein